MYRFYILLSLLTFVATNLSAQIVLNDSTLNNSVAYKAEILEDPNKSISLDAIIRTDTFDFERLNKPLEIVDYTISRWYNRFSSSDYPLNSW